MLIFLFFMTFIAGIGVGYMLFNSDLKCYNYVLKMKDKKIECKFKSIRSETWNDCDGLGKMIYEYVELVEK